MRLDKIIPDILPPKEPSAGVDFFAILDGFEPAALEEDKIREIAYLTPAVSGVTKKAKTYEFDGQTFLIPPAPIDERIEFGQNISARLRGRIIMFARKWQNAAAIGDEKGSRRHYKQCYDLLRDALCFKAALYVAEIQSRHMTPSEKEKEKSDWEEYDAFSKGKRLTRAQKERLEAQRLANEQSFEILQFVQEHEHARKAIYAAIQGGDPNIWAKLQP